VGAFRFKSDLRSHSVRYRTSAPKILQQQIYQATTSKVGKSQTIKLSFAAGFAAVLFRKLPGILGCFAYV
jgi:hypothetical protein